MRLRLVLKVGSRCGFCLLHRGYQQLLRATDNEDIRKATMMALLRMMANEYSPEAVPAIIGSQRDRLIQRLTGCSDPYYELKKNANEKALGMFPDLLRKVDSLPYNDRLRMACLISCLGNIIEYDVPGHNADIDAALWELDNFDFLTNDIEELQKLLGNGVEILYLTDNAGEIVFHRLVIREMQSQGCNVTVVVKGGPSLNDALLEDAVTVGMTKEANRVITTGNSAVGVNLMKASSEFMKAYYEADIIISKGMANWETLTEYEAPCPTMFLLRTKCEPVAMSVNTPLGKNIAKLVQKGWKL